MTSKQWAVFEQELRKQGLMPSSYREYLNYAIITCRAFAEVLRINDPPLVCSAFQLQDSAIKMERALLGEKLR